VSGGYRIFGTPPDDTGRPLTVVIADDHALVRGGERTAQHFVNKCDRTYVLMSV
jgi:hypothetical protein